MDLNFNSPTDPAEESGKPQLNLEKKYVSSEKEVDCSLSALKLDEPSFQLTVPDVSGKQNNIKSASFVEIKTSQEMLNFLAFDTLKSPEKAEKPQLAQTDLTTNLEASIQTTEENAIKSHRTPIFAAVDKIRGVFPFGKKKVKKMTTYVPIFSLNDEKNEHIEVPADANFDVVDVNSKIPTEDVKLLTITFENQKITLLKIAYPHLFELKTEMENEASTVTDEWLDVPIFTEGDASMYLKISKTDQTSIVLEKLNQDSNALKSFIIFDGKKRRTYTRTNKLLEELKIKIEEFKHTEQGAAASSTLLDNYNIEAFTFIRVSEDLYVFWLKDVLIKTLLSLKDAPCYKDYEYKSYEEKKSVFEENSSGLKSLYSSELVDLPFNVKKVDFEPILEILNITIFCVKSMQVIANRYSGGIVSLVKEDLLTSLRKKTMYMDNSWSMTQHIQNEGRRYINSKLLDEMINFCEACTGHFDCIWNDNFWNAKNARELGHLAVNRFIFTVCNWISMIQKNSVYTFDKHLPVLPSQHSRRSPLCALSRIIIWLKKTKPVGYNLVCFAYINGCMWSLQELIPQYCNAYYNHLTNIGSPFGPRSDKNSLDRVLERRNSLPYQDYYKDFTDVQEIVRNITSDIYLMVCEERNYLKKILEMPELPKFDFADEEEEKNQQIKEPVLLDLNSAQSPICELVSSSLRALAKHIYDADPVCIIPVYTYWISMMPTITKHDSASIDIIRSSAQYAKSLMNLYFKNEFNYYVDETFMKSNINYHIYRFCNFLKHVTDYIKNIENLDYVWEELETLCYAMIGGIKLAALKDDDRAPKLNILIDSFLVLDDTLTYIGAVPFKGVQHKIKKIIDDSLLMYGKMTIASIHPKFRIFMNGIDCMIASGIADKSILNFKKYNERRFVTAFKSYSKKKFTKDMRKCHNFLSQSFHGRSETKEVVWKQIKTAISNEYIQYSDRISHLYPKYYKRFQSTVNSRTSYLEKLSESFYVNAGQQGNAK